MGRPNRHNRKHAGIEAQEAFVRGFVTTILLASMEKRGGASRGLTRDGMRRAIKGGVAIASGTLVASGLRERRYSRSLAALAGGAACMILADHYLIQRGTEQDADRGKEQEIQETQE